MQFIDLAIQSTAVFAIVLFTFQFVAGLATRQQRRPAPVPTSAPAVEPSAAQTVEPAIEPAVEAAVEPPAKPIATVKPAAKTAAKRISRPAAQPVQVQPTAVELRRLCQQAGIRWRNAHSEGRHLSKAEMLRALGLG